MTAKHIFKKIKVLERYFSHQGNKSLIAYKSLTLAAVSRTIRSRVFFPNKTPLMIEIITSAARPFNNYLTVGFGSLFLPLRFRIVDKNTLVVTRVFSNTLRLNLIRLLICIRAYVNAFQFPNYILSQNRLLLQKRPEFFLRKSSIIIQFGYACIKTTHLIVFLEFLYFCTE